MRFVTAELFGEPAWDILLDLLRAEVAERRVSVSSVCLASGVPQTTALRYLKQMTARGMIVRCADPRDHRRVFVELAPEVSISLRNYFMQIIETPISKLSEADADETRVRPAV